MISNSSDTPIPSSDPSDILRVRCVYGDGGALDVDRYSKREIRDQVFHVTPGEFYLVTAMALVATEIKMAERGTSRAPTGLKVLICDDNNSPNWYPLDLFEVEMEGLPKGWGFRYLGYLQESVYALWGYHEMVDNPDHFDDLQDRVAGALSIWRSEYWALQEVWESRL